MKPKFRIFTDVSCDLTQQELWRYGVEAIPIGLNIGPLTFPTKDGRFPDPDEFYKMQKMHGLATTSGMGVVSIMNAFSGALDEGQDILFIGIDPDLSSASWNAMKKAKQLLLEKYPNRRIETPNTHSIAPGLGLIIDYMANSCDDDTTLDDALYKLDCISKQTAHWFTISEYKTLERGGRVNKFQAVFGTVLGIKPFMRLPYNGKLEVVEKIQGDKAMLKRFVEQVVKTAEPWSKIWLAYGAEAAKDRVKDLEIMLTDALPSNIPDITTHRIGPIIGAHTGPTVIAAFFFAKER